VAETGPENDHDQGRMLYWAAVVAILLGLTALYQGVVRNDGGMRLQQGENGEILVILERKRNGHFSADGTINGQAVSFLVDTGATDVAVSEKMARALGLDFGPEILVSTAAGQVRGWVTRLDSVQVGALVLRNVRATITPRLGKEALLGMSFLRHYSIMQEGDTLVIASRGENTP
jgi:aspartyl protease family protein